MSISCYRWSHNGFKTQKQIHLIEEQNRLLESRKTIIKKTSLSEQEYLLREHESNQLDPNFIFEGVFVFIKKPNKGDYSLYLNHIPFSKRPDFETDLHSKDFHEDTIVYVDNFSPNNIRSKMTLAEAKRKRYERVYLPKQ